jgi:hypothetical protein
MEIVFLGGFIKLGNQRTPFIGSGLTMLPIERGDPAINLVALGHL